MDDPDAIDPGILYAAQNLRRAAPRLYVGGISALLSTEVEFDALIDLAGGEIDCPGREDAFARVARRGRVLRWVVQDGGDLPGALLDAAWAIYRSCPGFVLVSCAAGASRSVAVAYALLRRMEKLGHDEAFARVALPNWPPSETTLASAVAWVGRHADPGVVLLRR